MQIKDKLKELTVNELLQLNGATITELRSRDVIRSINNPIGDYTEWLVARALGLNLTANSAAGYDAIAEDGRRVQIKARRISASNKSRQLGALRNLEKADFDDLVAVIFDDDFSIIEGVRIPHAVVGEYSVYRTHVNAHILQLRGAVLTDPRVENIREVLCAAALKS